MRQDAALGLYLRSDRSSADRWPGNRSIVKAAGSVRPWEGDLRKKMSPERLKLCKTGQRLFSASETVLTARSGQVWGFFMHELIFQIRVSFMNIMSDLKAYPPVSNPLMRSSLDASNTNEFDAIMRDRSERSPDGKSDTVTAERSRDTQRVASTHADLDAVGDETSPSSSTELDAAEEYLLLSSMTLAERIRFFYLKDRDLTEEMLAGMAPIEQEAIEEQISLEILKRLGLEDEDGEAGNEASGFQQAVFEPATN